MTLYTLQRPLMAEELMAVLALLDPHTKVTVHGKGPVMSLAVVHTYMELTDYQSSEVVRRDRVGTQLMLIGNLQ